LDSLVSCYPENVTKGHANFVHFSLRLEPRQRQGILLISKNAQADPGVQGTLPRGQTASG